MNKNKGFIGIGLILAIVLGIVVVGGGAYYLGKSGSKQAINNPENNLSNNENKNLPVVDNKQTSTPSITVLSPNGGETYKDTDKIAIKWNGISKDRVAIYLRFFSGEWCEIKDVPSSSTNYTFTPYGHDCGPGRGVISGTQKYKITLIAYKNGGMVPEPGTAFATSYSDGDDASYSIDSSDNYFTINSAAKTISTTDLKTYTNTEGNKVPYDILPNEYVSLQNGSWPLIESSSTQYVCNISNGYGDVPTVIKESIINGRKYCIESTTEGAAGSSYTTYSYKTNNNMGGSIGIKSLNFTLRSANCGVFRDNSTSGGIKYNECQKAQVEIFSKLNIIVDSIMFL